MNVEAKLSIQVPGAETQHLDVSLADDDRGCLESFLSESDQLHQWPQLRDSVRAHLSMRFVQTRGLTVTVVLPPWDLVGSLLHRLRPFILESEPYSFLRVRSLLGRRLPDAAVRMYLRSQHDVYSGGALRAQIRVRSNGIDIISEAVLGDWLNGFEYHRDAVRRRKLEDLHRLMPLELSKYFFISVLTDKIRAIVNLGGVASVVLGKQDSFEVDARGPDAT